MKRVVDLFLIVAFVGIVAVGAYVLGRRVDHTSNNLSAQDSELSRTTAASPVRHTSSNRTPYFVLGGVGGAVALVALGSAFGSMRRRTRRQTWRAT